MTISSDMLDVVTYFCTTEGRDIVLNSHGDNVYNPETGESTSTIAQHTLRGIVFDYTLQSNGTSSKHGTIEVGDKQVYLLPTSIPSGVVLNPVGDTLDFDNSRWRIISIKEMNPTGALSVLFELLVRK